MLLDFAALHLIQGLTFWDEPLAIDRSVHKIVSRNQSKRAQTGWNLRPKGNSKIQVIGVPIFVKHSLMYRGVDGVVIGRNLVEVLGRYIQAHHRIPVHTSYIFLSEQRIVFI